MAGGHRNDTLDRCEVGVRRVSLWPSSRRLSLIARCRASPVVPGVGEVSLVADPSQQFGEDMGGPRSGSRPADLDRGADDDYLELLKTEPTDLRIFFYNILDRMPELLKDFKYPDIGLKFFKRLPVLFFGGGDSRVFVHYDIDLPDSMHFHFHGTKSVTLFPQSQSKYLYKVPFSIHNIDKIDLDNPDFDTYPALQYAEGIQVNMKHGDALYMPSGYWHYIKYLDGGFSMTLRAFPRHPKKLALMLYNVFIMRHFDNIMRHLKGQKWLNYKETLAIKRSHKNLNRV
jgi:hypothetical protein